tara:strand:- start:31564 stop:31872 length:309 start_codon:yes stop_codon:yes gene_type:complete
MNQKQLIAKQRIKQLFKQAKQAKEQSLSNRYVKLARKIAMKAQIPVPRAFKRQYCKHCYTYLNSKNSRIRLQGKGKGRRVVYTCLNCKKHMRFMYKSKKASK